MNLNSMYVEYMYIYIIQCYWLSRWLPPAIERRKIRCSTFGAADRFSIFLLHQHSRYLHSRVYRHLYRARLFALADHERIVGGVLNRALVFGVNEATEGENEIERRSETKRVQTRYRREKERKRKADSTARTNRECACVLILEPSLPQINVFASNTFLLRFILLPVPCNPAESLTLSLSLSLFLPISLPSRSLPFLFSRAPPRDNNYPFDSCARCSQSHDPSSCYFPLCPSISSMSKSICNRLFSSSPSPARLIDICLNCIRGTFN